MKCINPIYLVRPGFENEQIRIDSSNGLRYRMVSIKNAPHWFRVAHPDIFMETPCGKCFACRLAKTREWALRLVHELRSWNQAVFLTLTYDDVCMPKVKYKGERVGTLVKEDLQLFIKRIRKAIFPYSLKYYAVGEYGEHSFRPHYHLIIYGMSRFDESLFKSRWRHGIVNCGEVTLESCQYVAGYVQKKLYGDVSKEVYGNRLPPFSLMSKGLGKDFSYIYEEQAIHNRSFTFHGSRFTVPRYYLKKNEELKVSCKVASSVHLDDNVNKFAQMSETELSYYIDDVIRERNQRIKDFKARERMNSIKKL